MYILSQGTSGRVMVINLDRENFMSDFESHWVHLSYCLAPYLSKKFSQLQPPSHTQEGADGQLPIGTHLL